MKKSADVNAAASSASSSDPIDVVGATNESDVFNIQSVADFKAALHGAKALFEKSEQTCNNVQEYLGRFYTGYDKIIAHQDAFTEAMAISVNSLKEHDAQEWKQTIIYDIAEDRKSVKTVLYVNLLILIVMVIATLYAFYRAS